MHAILIIIIENILKNLVDIIFSIQFNLKDLKD